MRVQVFLISPVVIKHPKFLKLSFCLRFIYQWKNKYMKDAQQEFEYKHHRRLYILFGFVDKSLLKVNQGPLR